MSNHKVIRFVVPTVVVAGAAVVWLVGSKASAARSPARHDVVINEVVSSNSRGLRDEDGVPRDWLELYNPGAEPAAMGGWSLSDDPDDPDKWPFPDVEIPAGGYLVVFASGQDRRPEDGPLHTNFELRRAGEYLALSRGGQGRETRRYEVPRIPTDVSFGRTRAGRPGFFARPTPGASNSSQAAASAEQPAPVEFETTRGFYDSPVQLRLAHSDPSVTIQYTTDGSRPTSSHGTQYTGPIAITEPTVVRAVAVHADQLASDVTTHTFVVGAPQLRHLPVVSVAIEASDLTGPLGIVGMSDELRRAGNCPRRRYRSPEYFNPIRRGRRWERRVSVELFGDDRDPVVVDSGIRVAGSDHTRMATCHDSKFSFELNFRDAYGGPADLSAWISPSPVTSYRRVVLRAGLDDNTNPFIRDELARRLFADMGNISARGTFAHLFINGSYRGYYNLTQKIDSRFLRETVGAKADWDIVKIGRVKVGDATMWRRLLEPASSPSAPRAGAAAQIAQRLDLENFADYLLLNAYAATWDWPHNNWIAFRARALATKFRFAVWDAEGAFGYDGHGPDFDVFAEALRRHAPGRDEISSLYRTLADAAAFRTVFERRAALHLCGQGTLTDAHVRHRYDELREELESTIADFDAPRSSTPLVRSGLTGHRGGRDHSIGREWIPQRRAHLLTQLRREGYTVDCP